MTSVEINPASLNWWQEQEARFATRNGGRLVCHHQQGKPSYFTIEGDGPSRPFEFSSSFYEYHHGEAR